ncbi:hypothetical protein B7463_g4731, partial [Scytalidium lignicola]
MSPTSGNAIYGFAGRAFGTALAMIMANAGMLTSFKSYELQADVNGMEKAMASRQKYFPLYILAPYRLLCVIAGLFVAFFWTIFPVQISEHTILHFKVSTSLSLLVKYSSLVSGTLYQRLHDLEGDLELESSPMRRLKNARYKILYQELALLAQMREHSTMMNYEVSIGGKFPKEEYDLIVEEIQKQVLRLSFQATTDIDDPALYYY